MAENFRRPYFSVSSLTSCGAALSPWQAGCATTCSSRSRSRAPCARSLEETPTGEHRPPPFPPAWPTSSCSGRRPLARGGPPRRLGPLQRPGDSAGRPAGPAFRRANEALRVDAEGRAATASTASRTFPGGQRGLGITTASTTSATACSACAIRSPTSTPVRFSSR